MLESLFNKVANLKACNFIKKRLWHRFTVNIAKFLRKPFLNNICEWLLLQFSVKMYLLYVNSMEAEGCVSRDMYLDNIPYQAPTMELFAEIANCYFCKKFHLIFEICLKWFWICLCITWKHKQSFKQKGKCPT